MAFAVSAFVAGALLPLVYAQQFEDRTYPYDILGVGEQCFEALNSTVIGCSWILHRQTGFDAAVDILSADELADFCTADCRSSLGEVEGLIQSRCTGERDVVVIDSIAYPATYFVDNYLYSYDISCQRDPATSEFCDVLFTEAGDEGFDEFACSDCWLGMVKAQLETPLAYDEDLDESFSSLTSSCSAAGYEVATPTPYALNSTAPPGPAPTCARAYMVAEGDTCESISLARSVSTHGIVTQNAFGGECEGMRAGKSICLPEKCDVHLVDVDDTCESLGMTYDAKTPQLVTWNPNLTPDCDNLFRWSGTYICVSPPGGRVVAAPGDSIDEAVPAPPDVQPESADTKCGRWHKAVLEDSCALVSIANQITLDDFYFLNPGVDDTCSNLWVDASYCVKPVGNIETYPGYPVIMPETSFTRPPISTVQPTEVPLPTLLPFAPGTDEDCHLYTYVFEDEDWDLDKCEIVARGSRITVDDFMKWNPSLSEDSCLLQPGLQYCVAKTEIDEPSPDPMSPCLSGYGEDDIVPGTHADCTCYNFIDGVMLQYDYTCEEVANDNDLSLARFLQLNSWLSPGDTCEESLFSGLTDDYYDRKWLCVGTANEHPPESDPSTPTPTDEPPTPPAPTQPGTVPYCTRWHEVVDGDGCWSIYTEYGLDPADFYSWNTELSEESCVIWLGYAVCIGVV